MTPNGDGKLQPVSCTDIHRRLSTMLEDAINHGERFIITWHKREVAVLMSYDDYIALTEKPSADTRRHTKAR